MKKLAILGSTLGLLVFGSILSGASTAAAAEQPVQSVNSEVVFPTAKHSLFTEYDVNNTRAIKKDGNEILVLASLSNLNPKYDLKIGELDLNGTGVYNVKNAETENFME